MNDSLTAMQHASITNSVRWFPELHARGLIDQVVHQTLGLAGEVGEVANLVKKTNRAGGVTRDLIDGTNIREELADVFTYLLNLAALLECDLPDEWSKKQAICEQRWGTS